MKAIGKDSENNKLYPGDICTFIAKIPRATRERSSITGQTIYQDVLTQLSGKIVYDEDSYAYAFETNDDFCPILLMSVVEYGSIKKKGDENECINANV